MMSMISYVAPGIRFVADQPFKVAVLGGIGTIIALLSYLVYWVSG